MHCMYYVVKGRLDSAGTADSVVHSNAELVAYTTYIQVLSRAFVFFRKRRGGRSLYTYSEPCFNEIPAITNKTFSVTVYI